jgi:hypothetical protein
LSDRKLAALTDRGAPLFHPPRRRHDRCRALLRPTAGPDVRERPATAAAAAPTGAQATAPLDLTRLFAPRRGVGGRGRNEDQGPLFVTLATSP